MDIASIRNRVRNKLGQAVNIILPPGTEVFPGSGTLLSQAIVVAPRWDYRSRFVGDALIYTRFMKALMRCAKIVYFVPIENRHAMVSEIRRLAHGLPLSVIFSSFQKVEDIPDGYFDLTMEKCYLVNWHTDDDMLFDRFSMRIARYFSLNITTYEPNLPRYEAIGANAIRSQWAGIDDCEFLESRRYAACFVGRMYGARASLVERLRKEFGDRVFLHDTRTKSISDSAMISAYQNSWIAVDDPLAYDGKTLQIKARVFEGASMGCLVATRENHRVDAYFHPGREILFWKTPDDLVDIVQDSIGHPGRYREMAYLAYKRACREHLYEHRLRELFTHILHEEGVIT